MSDCGATIRCCRLSVVANTRSGRICGASIQIQTRFSYGSKGSARTSVEHYSNRCCRRKNAGSVKPGSERRMSAADMKSSRPKPVGQTRAGAGWKKKELVRRKQQLAMMTVSRTIGHSYRFLLRIEKPQRKFFTNWSARVFAVGL